MVHRYLVEEAGVDPCQCDWDGNTAADVARQHQRQALVTYLEVRSPSLVDSKCREEIV